MRLLRTKDLGFEEFLGEEVPKYAILSHTWEQEEISYQEMNKSREDESIRLRLGYKKILYFCTHAAIAEIEYGWVDTCCINKESSAELSEAINSMYRWYKDAAICYAYLGDVPDFRGDFAANSYFSKSRWFTRGWTLQELIAPVNLIFMASNWQPIATREELNDSIPCITGIHEQAFRLMHLNPNNYSIAQKMSWAAKRTTTRYEDRAYCLMGLFNVSMPLLYGEGAKAFIRLQTAIINQSDDHTIFAWTDKFERGRPRGLLAPDASYFEHSRDIVRKTYGNVSRPYNMTNMGLQIQLELSEFPIPRGFPGLPIFAAPLNCNSGNDRVILLLAFAEKRSEFDLSDTDQFCRTDCSTLKDIPDHYGKFRTIFLKQVERPLPTPQAVWIRNIHTDYTLDRVIPSSMIVSGSVIRKACDPQCPLFLRLPVGSSSNHAILIFTHPNKSEFTVDLQQTYAKWISIVVDQTDEPSTVTWLSGCRSRIKAPKWLKIGAHVECVLGCLVYVLDVDVAVSVAGYPPPDPLPMITK